MKRVRSDRKYTVFFLTSWYPNRLDPLNGIFIKRHAESIAKYCKVVVVNAVPDRYLRTKTYDTECSRDNGILNVRVYYKMRVGGVRIPGVNLVRYMRACHIGFRLSEKLLGRPDIVHVNVAFPSGLLALLLRRLNGYKYVITEHSSSYTSEDGRYGTSPSYVRLITKLIYENAEMISAPSEYLLNALRKRHLATNGGIVVPNVVEVPEHIQSRPRYVGRVKALTVSSLTDRDKNLSGLVRAFANASKDCKKLELSIVGVGPDRERLEDLASQVGKLDQGIFFQGLVHPEELRKFYLGASFFVLNSNYETFSVATAEALAYGLPVIVTRCGGPPEYVSEKQGILIDRENEGELINALRLMCKTWQRYNRLAIHRYAKKRFNPERVGKAFHEIYKQALGGDN